MLEISRDTTSHRGKIGRVTLFRRYAPLLSRILAGLAVFACLAVGIRATLTPWHISATSIRENSAAAENSWDQAWNPQPPRKPDPGAPFAMPEVSVSERDVWIERRLIEPPRSHGGWTGATTIQANENGEATLPGGYAIRLEMAGLWVPGDPTPEFRFFDPATGEPKPALPEISRFQPTSFPFSPTLRLVFSGSGTDLWDRNAEVFDKRTHYRLDPGLSPDGHRQMRPIFDVPLGIWHDTPLAIMLRLPCGNAETAALPAQPGEQCTLPCGVRFQFIATGRGSVREVGRRGENWDITGENQRFILGRVSPAVWAANCRFRYADAAPGDPAPWFQPSWFASVPRIQAAHLAEFSDRPAELVCYPKRAHVWFEIAHLTGMPNPRSTRNLFEVEIPGFRSTSPNEKLYVAAKATEMDGDLLPFGLLPGLEPDDPTTARTVTPNQLLKEYREAWPDYRIRIDKSTHEIIVEPRPESLWERGLKKAKAWLPGFAP